ncbi:MAG: hypothetical protein LBH87_01845 [Coriobacteriales bacterium]|jgi:hypothetical protein|nr:hypothetical protein [Coriobacteriales bacterium]
MLPLNFAILKLFEEGEEYDTIDVMEKLQGQYSKFRAFKFNAVQESLMSAEKNGMLDEVRYGMDANENLRVYYKANDYGMDMIKNYIK